METVVLIMIILVCFNYIIKQTYRKMLLVLLSAVVCALFVAFAWPYAIEQSMSKISDWLANTSLMLDIAVILTVEVALQMAFCITAADIHSGGEIKKIKLWIYRCLKYFPDLLILPVLFSILTATIFALPGVSFSLIAYVLSATLFILILLAVIFIKKLLPEKEIRLELLFLLNALVALLGIIATVNGNTAVTGISEVKWDALLGLMMLIIISIPCGIAAFNFKTKKIIKNK